MKHYILCTILLGNLALGMDDPHKSQKGILENLLGVVFHGAFKSPNRLYIEQQVTQLKKELFNVPISQDSGPLLDELGKRVTELLTTLERKDVIVTEHNKLECLSQLVVQINQAVDGQEKRALAQQIIGLRKELGRTELYQDLPAGSYPQELDAIIEQMPVENKPAAAKPSVALFGSHPADFYFDDIYHASKEELAANYPNTNPDSDIGRAVIARMSKLQDIALRQTIAEDEVVKKFAPVDNLVSEMEFRAELQKARDTVLAESVATPVSIAQMNSAQLEALIKENTGKMYPPDSQFLKDIDARAKELKMYPNDKKVETPAAVTAESPAAAASELLTFDLIPQMTEEQVHSYKAQILAEEGKINVYLQSQLDERLEEIAIDRRVKEAEIVAHTSTKIQFKEEEIPAPFTKDDFEDVLVPDEDFSGSKGAQPVPDVVVGTDLVAQPVSAEASPLATGNQIAQLSPQSPAPEMQDSLNSGEITDPETPRPSMIPAASASVAPKVIIPDTHGDAALAEKLSLENQTPGGPDLPQLPVEPIARKASIEDLKATLEKDDETPGGPEDQAESQAQDSSYAQPEQQGLNAMQKTLLVVGVIAAVYSGTEMVVAYKSIPEKQWKENSGFMNKVKLVLGKTWQNVKSRPSQLRRLAKQMPVAGASVLEKMKAKAKAA